MQTAREIAPYLEPETDDRLIEMEYGPYEGLGLDSLPEEVLEFFGDFANNPAPEGMEPLEDVVSRAGSFMEDRCKTDLNILISTHAIAMKGILEHLTPKSNGSYWSKHIGNCSVYVTEFKDGKFTVPREYRFPIHLSSYRRGLFFGLQNRRRRRRPPGAFRPIFFSV